MQSNVIRATESPATISVGWARRLAWLGMAWALSYVPIHLWWAAGGTTAAIGITPDFITRDFRLANISASIVLAGAGLACLALVQRWGAALPGALRHGVAWFGGLFGILHAVVFCGMAGARLLGWADYPTSVSARRHGLARRTADGRTADGRAALATSLLLVAGVGVTTVGTMVFQPWLFFGVGPLLLAAGVVLLVRAALR